MFRWHPVLASGISGWHCNIPGFLYIFPTWPKFSKTGSMQFRAGLVRPYSANLFFLCLVPNIIPDDTVVPIQGTSWFNRLLEIGRGTYIPHRFVCKKMWFLDKGLKTKLFGVRLPLAQFHTSVPLSLWCLAQVPFSPGTLFYPVALRSQSQPRDDYLWWLPHPSPIQSSPLSFLGLKSTFIMLNVFSSNCIKIT